MITSAIILPPHRIFYPVIIEYFTPEIYNPHSIILMRSLHLIYQWFIIYSVIGPGSLFIKVGGIVLAVTGSIPSSYTFTGIPKISPLIPLSLSIVYSAIFLLLHFVHLI